MNNHEGVVDLVCDERPCDSPFIETIWRSTSEQARPFISMADGHYAMVIARSHGKTTLTVRGPETSATMAMGLADAELLGVRFKPGVYIPELPPAMTMDRHDMSLAEATSGHFWLNGSAWEFPDTDNLDTFVERLVRDGCLVRDPVVAAMVEGHPPEMSVRTAQRRFQASTGLTHSTMFQIERARFATQLLKQGVSALDTVHQAGYYDQAHMTRSLRRYIGLTPGQIADQGRTEGLSFLYKTMPLAQPRMTPQEESHGKSSRL